MAYSQTFKKSETGITGVINGVNIELKYYNSSTVRVIKHPSSKPFKKECLAVISKPSQLQFSSTENKYEHILQSKDLRVTINLTSGEISFFNTKGKSLLKEKDAAIFIDFDDNGDNTYKVKQSFVLDSSEAIYGLGILQNGKMSQRGTSKMMIQNNTEDFVTFFQSVKGYGVFWDNYSPTEFQDSAKSTSFESEVGDAVDYYFMNGNNADGVIANMRKLTGDVPMFPLWTYGYFQSKERYKSQNELVSVVDKYRQLQIPLDGVIQDWQYWGNNYLWNAMDFLNPEFPEPQKMVDDIHKKNAHLLISIWSSFGPHTKPYKELNDQNMLFNFKTWPLAGTETWPPNPDYPSGVKVYDAYNPKAREIYWQNLKRLYDFKIDGWWMDSTEPDHLNFKPEDFNEKTYLGSFRKVRNAYPLVTVGGVYNHQRAESSEKRVFILTRSGFAGQQRYGANVWSGDTSSSWETLRNQIPAGLNFTLTGNPNFNSDIGGFFANSYNKSYNDGTAVSTPLFQELYVRWLQYGAFNPMMRSHGADVPREIYQFGKQGEPIFDAISDAIHLRYSFLPYIYSTSWDVTHRQGSFMRSLVMDFADDNKTWDINNEFMFGKSLLVSPIVNAQYTPEKKLDINEMDGWNKTENQLIENKKVDFLVEKQAKIYLPKGSSWFDFFTNKKYTGGQTIEIPSTIKTIPLYVKSGSILPIGEKVQYATEKTWDNLAIKVYTGANADFTLYEDEFDNYNYEKGIYSEITMHWNESSKIFTISDRKGKFPGMLENRTFHVVLDNGNKKTIQYSGKKISAKF